MVDVWLITTMLFPFIEIAGLAYRTSLRGQLSRSTPVRSLCKEGAPPHLHTSTRVERLLRMSQVFTSTVLPLAMAAFTLTYWAVGLAQLNWPASYTSYCPT